LWAVGTGDAGENVAQINEDFVFGGMAEALQSGNAKKRPVADTWNAVHVREETMMDDIVAVEGQTAGPGLSQVERVVDTFVAPTKTFKDILRDSSWWLPYLLGALLGILFAYVILNRVGLATLVDGVVHHSKTLEDTLANATSGDAARIRGRIETQFKFAYAGPVIGLLSGLLCAGILLATANFVFGGKAKYKQMLAVWFYASLPLVLFYLLVIISIYAGMGGDQFDIQNAIGTNIGYYLSGSELPRWVVTLLAALDVFAIWTALLLTLGVSIVAGIKRSSAAIVVFGWWFLFVLLKVVGAAFTG
jgi:hypothetical protein